MRLWALKRRLWIRGMLGAGVSAQRLRSLGTVTLWHFQIKEEDSGRITDNQSDSNRPLPLSLVEWHLQQQSTPWGWGSEMRLWRGKVRLWALK